jgi:lipopolysaccharide-induced tumor necrosis factor-alpha factor
MSDYYSAPVRSGIESQSPATPNEKHTLAVYHGPPQVIGGAGRPMSQYPQSNDDNFLPSYQSPSSQPTPPPESSVIEKRTFASSLGFNATATQEVIPPISPISPITALPEATPKEENLPSQKDQQDPQVIPIGLLDQNSGFIKCPECGESHLTNTTRVIGGTNQLSYFQPPFFWRWTDIYGSMWALLATLVAACFVPYMMNSLKNVEHRCSNCDVHLATWYRASGTRRVDLEKKSSKKK